MPGTGYRSRPQSGTRGRSLTRTTSKEAVSYEDLLIAQYLDELRKSPPQKSSGATTQQVPSPYLQKLPHAHILPAPTAPHRARPQSAYAKPKIDPKFIDNPDLWDPTTPENTGSSRRRLRPTSAPVYKRPSSALVYGNRGLATSVGSHRVRSMYRFQPYVIVVTAFKNGCRDTFARITAPNIKILLEQCTEKLELCGAARRVFLPGGNEVFMPQEIPRDAEVYISMGEPFKDPYRCTKKQTKMSRSTSWTMNGLILAPDTKKRPTRSKLSKRFRQLSEQTRRRVLVYRNGFGSEGFEIVASLDKFEDFLAACTAKLELGTYARMLYDWEGREVHNLDEAPVMDMCLQRSSTPVLGPLWVSKGEGFSPKGVQEFLTGLISYTKLKLKEAKNYQQQLQDVQDEDTRDRVDMVVMLSMTETEVEETLEIVAKDIEDFSNALNHLKQQMEKIQELVLTEQDEGMSFTLKHIEKFDTNHKLVGTRGLKLKVYENGTDQGATDIYFNIQQAMRGLNKPDMILTRLLDQCSFTGCLSNPKHNPAIRATARKLYSSSGKEVKDINELEYDSEVWLSFGEPWKNPFSYIVCAQFDKVRVFEVDGMRRQAVREQLMSEDSEGNEKSSLWEVCNGVPEKFDVTKVSGDDMGNLEESEISMDSDFLQSKTSPSFLLYPEVSVQKKVSQQVPEHKKGDQQDQEQHRRPRQDVWPAQAATWVITKSGHIYSKAMPQLALAVLDQKVTTTVAYPGSGGRTGGQAQGLIVGLKKRSSRSPEQTWIFTADGFIYAQSQPELVLTYLGSVYADDSSHVTNSEEGLPKGHQLYLAVCERLGGKDVKSQRWGLKQEKIDILGQWKKTKVDNPEWNKKALSWPVDGQGEWNEDYEWPMEGFLMPYAPPVKKSAGVAGAVAPLKLRVLKNGLRDASQAVCVVGPDLTNMKKDTHARKKQKRRHNHQLETDADSIATNGILHCDKRQTITGLEFTLFLERCTSLLDLPFAARRLFDSEGNECFRLQGLERDQLVYVSCGEPWSDPRVSKADQQRHRHLANLASDISQIRQFVKLRNPQDLVLEVEGPLVAGTRLVVGHDIATMQRRSKERNGDRNLAEDGVVDENVEEDRDDMGLQTVGLTSHEIAHAKADERLNRRRWPWERIVNGEFDDVIDANDESLQFGDKEQFERYTPRQRKHNESSAQKFSFDDGYITCLTNSRLVLGVHEIEGLSSELVLLKRKSDDVTQKWILQDNGSILSKYNPRLALTVRMPSGIGQNYEEDPQDASCNGCAVILHPKKVAQFGRANQRWYFDHSTGIIHAFHTNPLDKEITAAIKTNVCTYAVIGDNDGDNKIDQPGYEVELTKPKRMRLRVCPSCAQAMRGRFKLKKITGSIDFSCDMGRATELGIKPIGSFKCLNGKVDLSTHEATHTLEEMEAKIARLQNECSVRVIARNISAARVPYTVKVLAYKNGDGRKKPGSLLVGSSVAGILDQATSRLELTKPARRLYALDGFVVLHIDDLVEWVQGEYVRRTQKQMRAEARARKEARAAKAAAADRARDGQSQELMEKVQLDSEESSEEEEEDEEGEDEDSTMERTRSDAGRLDTDAEFIAGKEASANREHIDRSERYVIVPSPGDVIEQDGYIVSWELFTCDAGIVYLLVLSPETEDPETYTVICQHKYIARAGGKHPVDVSRDPMQVHAGNVIGFYCPGAPIVTFDVVRDRTDVINCALLSSPPEMGQKLHLSQADRNSGTRDYSFNALIVPVHKINVKEQGTGRTVAAARRKGKMKKQPHVEVPPVEMILRYPVEVWVSSGEPFCKPESVERNSEKEQLERERLAPVSYELEKEKHILRQMQGRRLEELNPGEYHATRNPQHPVMLEGHWQDPPLDELLKHDTVHQLQTHLTELRSSQRKKTSKMCNGKTTGRLYTQPAMKRVLVFPNGESLERAVYVWGESMAELQHNSTERLRLRKDCKHLFSVEGILVDDFADIERDQLLCAATSKTFLRPKEAQQGVDVKANWGRARRHYGPGATDIVVTAQKNRQIEVDPFGPSSIAGTPTEERRGPPP